ncbi:MAG: phosphoribosylglycinamide formyltransferase [Magnetovibrio sp.]|nr:phosphoribosylglycinamide formyltransferase [Magnetovibrio sp.]|tara:strand:+ start:2316 stop:2966 length:651 start_codon:yes stop_codon:yes gene_type:complete
MAKLKLCVFISGRGSNLQSLIDACTDKDYPAQIVLVISNVDGVLGLERAKAAGIQTLVFERKNYKNSKSLDAAMNEAIKPLDVNLICLAGYMRILSDKFVDQWRDRMINIHPSLLPAFKGLNVQQRAIDSGVRFSGCTVHYVRRDMDTGPIIVQAVVPVLNNDDSESLAARILAQEHKIYPLAVRLIAQGLTTIINERVLVDSKANLSETQINPKG